MFNSRGKWNEKAAKCRKWDLLLDLNTSKHDCAAVNLAKLFEEIFISCSRFSGIG
jgi:hypothetical protein